VFTFPIHENFTYRAHLLSLNVTVYAMSSMGFMLSAGSFADHNGIIPKNTIYES